MVVRHYTWGDGFEDQYGGGWSGGHRDDSGGGRGGGRGGGSGGGGGQGGGDAGGGKPGSKVEYQKQLPKFLQQYAHILSSEGFQDEARQAWDDYAQSDKLAKYGDDEDISGIARKGLGINSGAGYHAKGTTNDVVAKQELAKEEKGKGNRAFQDKRFEDAVKHFSVCIRLDESLRELHPTAGDAATAMRAVYHSNRSAAYAALKDFEAALADGLSAVKFSKQWVKGHIRVGAAYMGLKRYTDARESYEKALALEEDNEHIKSSLKEAGDAEEASIRQGSYVFVSKRKRSGPDGGGSSSAIPKAKHFVQDKKLLSFDDEDA